MDTRRDLAMAFGLIALGIFVIVVAQSIAEGIYRDAVGPRAFPIGIGVLFLITGSLVALNRVRHMNASNGYVVVTEGAEDEENHPASATRAVLIVALTFAYAALLQPLGYLISTFLYVVAALAAMADRRFVRSSVISLVWTVSTYVIFAQGLGVRMPVGPFRQLFRDLGLITL